ncbi:TonB-dependent receptor [Sphingomonas sp. BGYR3]|uniref:TonB-dependent receptor n=1 Tax=Sphingomonas sp. BGYR3 TaxID=2975483 RepID=UPI0021A3BEB7|nr:TonB-dependent receptor [Sphingomonas sp. BGYR3]MDG5489738.1 TonB-dependent receptor [Sphingomonas sp. BGYR3]
MSRAKLYNRGFSASASHGVIAAAMLMALAGPAYAHADPEPSDAAIGDTPLSDAELAAAVGMVMIAQETTDADQGEILVVGSRASQQSANERKRNARTATDSIVADDIGSFPDRNVAEAVSRLPGVALARNDFGEGESVAVRGNGPDLTRVELDGVGVSSASGAAINADAGRSADLRELPAELVKSIDVVKGSTADQTEGSLGGGIQIKTRNALDFRKPFYQFSGGFQQNSLTGDWTPNFNSILTRKFFDGRVGVLVSANYNKIQNINHGYQNTTSGTAGYHRRIDFDNSPEKTFVYNLDTLTGDAADQVFANSTETPRSLLTKSIAAQSKADCFAAFPNLPTGSSNQRGQRVLELQSCLNQWNDYTPSLIRNFMNEQNDERVAIDARIDFRATDNLLFYAKTTISRRDVEDQNRSRNPVQTVVLNPAGTFLLSNDGTNSTAPAQRTVNPNGPAGYYLYDGVNTVTQNRRNPNSTANPQPLLGNQNYMALGNVVGIVPNSVVVDALHNVTQMTTTNNVVNIDQIQGRNKTDTYFYQGGLEWRSERVDIDAFAGMSSSTGSRADQRTNRSYAYGDATITLQPNGLWDIDFPDAYDESNIANFVQLRAPTCIGSGTAPTCIGQNAVAAAFGTPASPAYTVGQMPLVTPNFQVQFSPFLAEIEERLAKADVTYRTDGLLPFITRVKVGAQYRSNSTDRWAGGGYNVRDAVGTFGTAGYVPPVVVPTANVRGQLRACQPTATSTLSCNYGFVPFTQPLNSRSGVDTVTPEELTRLFTSSLEDLGAEYFGDLPNRGNLPPAWTGILTDQLFSQLGAAQFINFDCVKVCTGSDGNQYEQPLTRTREEIRNVYAMLDFEQKLPWGLEFDGNIGLRGVFTKVEGTGVFVLRNIRTTAAFDPNNPTAAAGIVTTIARENTTISNNTTDWLPSVNLNLWAFDRSLVFRAYGGKTVARPPVSRLLASGECTIDERTILSSPGDGEDLFACPGRVGNPGLSPFTAWNYNYSLEWYPNRDTVLSATYGKLDVQIGSPIGVTVTGSPFSGSDLVDQLTGRPISELQFTYPTFADGPGYKRDIWEFQAKTAFTFLPWFLKYTGADVNVSVLSSVATTGQQDPLSGDVLPPPDQSRLFTNASLWYDDGKLNIRVAYQKRTERFTFVTPGGGTGDQPDINYPGQQWGNVRLVAPGYNPGVARYIDATTFIDAKIAYNINNAIQVFVEGRNLTREAQTASTGDYLPFEDGTPRILQLGYGGRRILAGFRLRYGQ